MNSMRTFTREFKIETVRRVEEGDRTVKEAAEHLRIHPHLLYRCRTALITEQEDAFPGQGNVSSSEEELRCLRRENARLLRGFPRSAQAGVTGTLRANASVI